MDQEASVKPMVTIVHYDLTSSDEDLSDIEPADGLAFVYASSELPVSSCWLRADSEVEHGPSVSDRTCEETGTPNIAARGSSRSPQPALESLTATSNSLLIERNITVEVSDSDSDSEHDRTIPARVSSPKRFKAEPPVEEIASSSLLSSPDDKECDNSDGPRKKHYSLNMQEVPTELRHFMAKTKRFYTKPHSLERLAPCVATSTYAKAEERMLCKSAFFSFVKRPFYI